MGRTHDVIISGFDLAYLENQLAAVTEQRNRLAERLKTSNLQLQYIDEKYPTGTTPAVITQNEQALQSLNQN